MKNRILSTVGLWLGIILIGWLLGTAGGNLLLVVITALTQLEFYRLLQRCGYKPMLRTGIAIGALMTLSGFYLEGSFDISGVLIACSIVAVLIATIVREGVGKIVRTAAPTIFGIAAVPALIGFFNPILLMDHGLMLAIWVIAVVKFTDVGALLVGSWVGKTKLAPALSPKKTWEGVIGGLVFAAIAGALYCVLFADYLPSTFTPLQSLMITVPIAAIGVVSDLFESAIKREAGVKDSGNSIPGIGGAYDLADSLVFAAPVAYLLLALVIQG